MNLLRSLHNTPQNFPQLIKVIWFCFWIYASYQSQIHIYYINSKDVSVTPAGKEHVYPYSVKTLLIEDQIDPL